MGIIAAGYRSLDFADFIAASFGELDPKKK
jgi:hypothetical protein